MTAASATQKVTPAAPKPRSIGARALGIVGWLWPAASLCILVIVVAMIFGGGDGELNHAVTAALINLILVVGLYVFVGNSGVVSFGHLSFMAIGAYTSALLTVPVLLKHTLLPKLPHWLAVAHFSDTTAALIGGGVATVFALVAAGPLMRLTGLAAGIATFSLLIVVNVVAGNWTNLTRGQQTMIGVPLDTTVDQCLIWACIAIFLAYVFQQSRVGLRLRATREDEIAARAIGIGVMKERTIAFMISAFITGIAGALYAHYLGSFSASAFYLQLTFMIFVMLVIGGIQSLAGAVIGSVVVSAIAEVLLRLERGADVGPSHVKLPDGSQQIVLALFLLLILILRPKGLTGGREISWPFRRRLDPSGALEPTAPVEDPVLPDPAVEPGETALSEQ
jgi:branched-chain amino acid transport system permease protein